MADIDTTKIYLPKNLLYPLTVLKVHVTEGNEIDKHAPILTYKYHDYEPVPISELDEEQADENERKLQKVENVSTFDSSVKGQISKLYINANDKIYDDTTLIAEIIELCSHPIQYGGLCAICGQTLEEEEENKRAPILMAHGTTDLKVSSKEAENIERSSTERLLKEEKLSLVVDLDQTVIHVTVDPTVADWMADPTNPNYEAVKDVKSFTLEEFPFTPIGYKGPTPPPIIRWYYVKLRPGLQEFLSKMNERYEMHIYTMATRQYAESIAKIIDPDGIYFGERILSRDESGSLTQKSLKRLFPVDTTMVVVIDDRGDVWNWSPNLIKVVPYDFFLGIGDINSSFLPRQKVLLGPSKRRKSVNILEEKILNEGENVEENAVFDDEENVNNEYNDKELEKSNEVIENGSSNPVVSEKSSSPVDRLIQLNDNTDNANLLAVQENERSSALEQQEHDRPLARLQENLDRIIEEEEDEKAISENENENENENEVENKDENSKGEKPNNIPKHITEHKESHNLLYDDDKELEYLGQALVRIHNEFYFEFEKMNQEHSKKAVLDVKDIMTEMKSLVFQDCVFLLSGVLPLGTNLKNADIVIWAKSFGATFVENYTTRVTHVICKNSGTFKVRLAKSVDSKVKVVNPDWLFACMSLWDRLAEDDYIVNVDNLLSKAQIDDFMEFHGNTTLSNSEALDWGEIDEEMKEFMGSDYEDDEGDDDDIEDNLSNGIQKRALDEEENKVFQNTKRPKIADDDNADASTLSEDEFERDLLEHLADLE
jgi:RNA polymerase II subunit A-like phosphatase